ncbi:putative ABC transport system ATP-binding protein [Prosthecobacter fusiformis]|uniref:Putative ABC transport system ATP-binding protein n=1 Tax=Prosthecobacter fusiformis TaxID=48464 RepID=A0A4R7SR33_9BACT|nr:ABC transporter ATP-binding protein [Prosthecobacter fusiformis]TDU81700.1 putative ABC transport system ATP-binding protein [Prosthecobacter fusiformis]
MNPTSAPAGIPSPVYEAIHLKKEYDAGQVQALRGISFKVNAGEFVAITGPSGCGKSTLLQMLGALDRPASGTLNYRGQSLPDVADPSAYRAHEIGFIFQAFHLLPTCTAVENVQIPMFEGKLGMKQRRERAVDLLKQVGLGHRLDHYPGKLSGGERQRVAIARSLANSPTVLLADEPTGNLDSTNATHVLDLLVRLHEEQKMTLIMVTHDMDIARMAGRTILMKDGLLVSDSLNQPVSSLNSPAATA